MSILKRSFNIENYFELLLASFNHNGLFHFGINMFVLYNMATYMEHIIPPAEQFLSFYCSSGT
jgi:membrane associated rhomboid family serine protease